MEEQINVAEILKHCPKGMELYSPMFGTVIFEGVRDTGRAILIDVTTSSNTSVQFYSDGKFNTYYTDSEITLFPSKGKTWGEFVPPIEFKVGDVLYVDCTDDPDIKQYKYIFILNRIYNGDVYSFCHYAISDDYFFQTETYLAGARYPIRFATEEEKAILFQAIKDNGYKWNEETKTLEKLPKFKIGDWVVHHSQEGMIYQVEKSFLDGTYRIVPVNDKIGKAITTATEDAIHLWTIQDTKEGDVLIDQCDDYKNPLIFILKKFEKVDFGRALKSDYSSYCFLTMSDIPRFKEGSFHHKHDIKPATKEQRDVLFQKMKEAGYEWDAEKKELRKIEQKPAWSEEDEMILDIIASVLRVNFEPTERFIGCEDYMNVDLINWLRALKDRYTWKPSEEQIEALERMLNFAHFDEVNNRDIVRNLLSQLKKLREE